MPQTRRAPPNTSQKKYFEQTSSFFVHLKHGYLHSKTTYTATRNGAELLHLRLPASSSHPPAPLSVNYNSVRRTTTILAQRATTSHANPLKQCLHDPLRQACLHANPNRRDCKPRIQDRGQAAWSPSKRKWRPLRPVEPLGKMIQIHTTIFGDNHHVFHTNPAKVATVEARFNG